MRKNRNILLFGNPILRQVAKPVMIYHKKLHSLIDSISFTLDNSKDSAAIAANQMGILKRIIVINYEGEYLEMLNPEIISSDGDQIDYEGCLSFPEYVGLVPRAENISVKFNDRFGREFIIQKSGKLARCIQHEIDHLNGILYIDRMEEKYLIQKDTDLQISLIEVIDLANGTKEMKTIRNS